MKRKRDDLKLVQGALSTRDRRSVSTYSIKEASVYLGLPPSTLRWWFFGQQARGTQRAYDPIFLGADPDAGLVSFFNLVEAHILSSLRIEYMQLRTNSVRRALDYVRKGSPDKTHPLVTEHFETDGKSLFIKFLEDEDRRDSVTVNASQSGQLLMLDMDQHLKLIDYDKGLASKLFPIAGAKVIVLNPRISAGRPIVAGAGVLASIIRQRAIAGELPEDLARDYQITADEIKTAIQFIEAA